jgi:DNA modification methylase
MDNEATDGPNDLFAALARAPVIRCGDAIQLMSGLEAASVDLVLVDPPYGTTRAGWDQRLPAGPMWEQIRRVRSKGAATLVFGAQPFTTLLNASNLKEFRYDLIWEKSIATGHLNARRIPMRAHEIISVFYDKLPTYNPQMTVGHRRAKREPRHVAHAALWDKPGHQVAYDSTERFPRSVLKFASVGKYKGMHPTTKPVPLLRWLIETYSNPGDVVLDFCAGSGSTGVAAIECGRVPVLFEIDEGWASVCRKRVLGAED